MREGAYINARMWIDAYECVESHMNAAFRTCECITSHISMRGCELTHVSVSCHSYECAGTTRWNPWKDMRYAMQKIATISTCASSKKSFTWMRVCASISAPCATTPGACMCVRAREQERESLRVGQVSCAKKAYFRRALLQQKQIGLERAYKLLDHNLLLLYSFSLFLSAP